MAGTTFPVHRDLHLDLAEFHVWHHPGGHGSILVSDMKCEMAAATAGTSSVLVYDDIYEVCRDNFRLHDWLKERGIVGDFHSETCSECHEGPLSLVKDSSYKFLAFFGAVKSVYKPSAVKAASIRPLVIGHHHVLGPH